MLTFRDGGWVLVLAGLITLALATWALAPAALRMSKRPPGDGIDPATFGFDLSTLTVPANLIAAGMMHRDMVVTLDAPTILVIDDLAEEARGKYLVSTDRVIGVTIGGESRAYPLSVLNVHEIVHDTLGGIPIAVTYNWPSDCPAVFDRRVGGSTMTFGVSGLLLNSNLLMYDRGAPEGEESLWSQMNAVAVAGPAAGTPLTRVPSALTCWSRWYAAHPDTTILGRDPSIVARRYKKSDPDAYFFAGDVRFNADPMPPEGGPATMERVIAVEAVGARRVYTMKHLMKRADANGRVVDDLGGMTVELTVDAPSRTAVATSPDGPLDVQYAVWFAWHAAHPTDEVAQD